MTSDCRPMTREAQVAELVDALRSGRSDRKVVEVRVLSWAPYRIYKPLGIKYLAAFLQNEGTT